MYALCFFAGIAFLYFKHLYPLILFGVLLLFRPKSTLIFVFLFAVSWAFIHEWMMAPHGFPKQEVIKQAEITGVVGSLPIKTPDKTQFEFKLRELNHKPVRGKVLLSCYRDCPNISIGEQWHFKAKLKKPQNYGNPGGFDYISRLKSRHIHWIGYILPNQARFLQQTSSFPIQKLRNRLAQKIDAYPLTMDAKAIFKALTIGVGTSITQEKWELFRRTGTTHLLVISGAHIGFVTGIVFSLIKWVWPRCFGLAIFVPAQRVAAIGGLITALSYSVLAGFGIPARRAFIMCLFMLIRYLSPLQFSIWQAYCYALLSVLFLEPHCIYMTGFYLSFLAVAILITVNQVIAANGIVKTLILQLACLVGLMPLTLTLFSYGSVNGFFANIIAIPWVGFLLIPLAFLNTLIPLNAPLDFSISSLLKFLHWIDKLEGYNIHSIQMNLSGAICCLIGLVLLLIFNKKSILPAAAVLIVYAFYPKLSAVPWGETEVDVLDVGQGLSVVVRTAHHNLIYDTGAKFPNGGDMGEQVIVPYLKTLKTKSLDMVIISHPDLDHRGGLESIEKNYPINHLVVDTPLFYHKGENCHTHPEWRWDGVSFKFLPLPKTKKKNNHSCILKVSNNKKSMLLTGDIEALSERYLMKHYSEVIKATYLLVPHHGSNSSSTSAFLAAVSPKAAIVTYGFDNRYRHPHPKAMERYKAHHIPLYSTQTCGLIRIFLNQKNKLKFPLCSKYHKI